MRFYGEIQRVSGDDERMVWGYASTSQVAADGLTITNGALRDALADYMAFANIREMHQLSAVGITREASVDDEGLYIGAWVQDDRAWEKVKAGVYRGFSIGAKATARDPADTKTVTGIKLNEISLVDRPADPGAVFEVYRAAGNEDNSMKTKTMAASTDTAPVADAVAPETATAQIERAAARDARTEAPAAENATEVVATPAADAPAAEPTPEADVPAAPEPTPVERALAAATAGEVGLTAAFENFERAAAPGAPEIVLPGADIRRGLGTVECLGWILRELCYITQDAALEAAIEGDGSVVPAQLRTAVLALIQAYRAMAAEELEEMAKGVDVDVALEVGIIQLAAAASDIERAAGKQIDAETGARIQVAFDSLIARGWKPVAEEPFAAERDLLLRAVETLTDKMTAMTTRIGQLEAQPMPAKTAGPGAPGAAAPAQAITRAVGKGEDASAQPAAPTLSDDDVKRTLDSMSPEERALILTRAALARPYPISR